MREEGLEPGGVVYTVTAITEEGRKERRRRGTADFMKSKYRHNGRLAGRELHPFPSSYSPPFPLLSLFPPIYLVSSPLTPCNIHTR